MTREQIESAAPEQLDIWCAELMGWKWRKSVHGSKRDQPSRALVDPRDPRINPGFACEPCANQDINLPIADHAYRHIPRPTTDPAAAWGLLAWLQSQDDAIAVEFGLNVHSSASIMTAGPVDTPNITGYCEAHEHPDMVIRLHIALARAACLWGLETKRLPIEETAAP